MRRRSGLSLAALLGNGTAWFGAAGFLLVVLAGVGLAIGGFLDIRRIRHGRPETSSAAIAANASSGSSPKATAPRARWVRTGRP